MNVTRETRARRLFDAPILRRAVSDSFRKLAPSVQVRNPVMFVVWIGALLTSVLALQAAFGRGEAPFGFVLAISFWLWATVLFANFAEALAESRGRAQAQALRSARRDVVAKRLQARARPSSARAAATAAPSPAERASSPTGSSCARRRTPETLSSTA